MTEVARLTAAAISIKLIVEKFHEKILINSIAANEQIIIILGNTFFGILFIMVTAASKIKMPTASFIPLNAWAIIVISRCV